MKCCCYCGSAGHHAQLCPLAPNMGTRLVVGVSLIAVGVVVDQYIKGNSGPALVYLGCVIANAIFVWTLIK